MGLPAPTTPTRGLPIPKPSYILFWESEPAPADEGGVESPSSLPVPEPEEPPGDPKRRGEGRVFVPTGGETEPAREFRRQDDDESDFVGLGLNGVDWIGEPREVPPEMTVVSGDLRVNDGRPEPMTNAAACGLSFVGV